MFCIRDNVFPSKNVISKNVTKKTSYLPKAGYYSKSLKTDNKKQFRTNKGIENQIKLAEMKRSNLLKKPEKSLMELFRLFTPFKL